MTSPHFTIKVSFDGDRWTAVAGGIRSEGDTEWAAIEGLKAAIGRLAQAAENHSVKEGDRTHD